MNQATPLVIGSAGTTATAVGTAMQTNDVLQTISLVITIIGTILTFIIMPLIQWYRNAKKDGKIDKDEIKEGLDIIQNGVESVKENLNDKKKGE